MLEGEEMKDETLKLALEALENCYAYLHEDEDIPVAITAIKQALAAPTSAEYAMGYAEGFNDGCKPAPVQEPVAWMTQARNFVQLIAFTEEEAKLYGWTPVYTTPPAAQPAVPDAIHHTDLSESLEYIQGWNDCRREMMENNT
jgi:hypothetical protein